MNSVGYPGSLRIIQLVWIKLMDCSGIFLLLAIYIQIKKIEGQWTLYSEKY